VRGIIATHPELRHVRTRVKTPGQSGSRERGFGSLKYGELFLEEIPDALDLVAHADDYRIDYNTVRPHEALAWNRPRDVHLGLADPLIPNFPGDRRSASCLTRDTGNKRPCGKMESNAQALTRRESTAPSRRSLMILTRVAFVLLERPGR
jgi:hypothetical protein